MIPEIEKELIRQLQEEFPLCERPYLEIAQRLGVTEDEVLRSSRQLIEEKKMRRIAASVDHVSVGYAVNSMVVWDVPDEHIEEIASRVIRFKCVSHCYERERDPDFPYNLYTMVHAGSEEEFARIIEGLKEAVGPAAFCSLRTKRELKKTAMKYFI